MTLDSQALSRLFDAGNQGDDQSLQRQLLGRIAQLAALVKNEPASLGEVSTTILTDDIRQLVQEAFAKLETRPATFWDWVLGVDPRKEELARKTAAGEAASIQIQQRAEMFRQLDALFGAASSLRRNQLRAFLDELDLKEQIADRLTLSGSRIQTKRVEEESRQRKLLAVPPKPPTPQAQREVLIQERREDLQARATVRRQTLMDFEDAVREIFRSAISDQQKAAQIRAVLETYQQDESVLSPRIRAFLTYVEGDYGD